MIKFNVIIMITSDEVERFWPSYDVSRVPHVCDSECSVVLF